MYEEAAAHFAAVFLLKREKGEISMKKVISFAMAVAMVAALFTGCGASASTDPNTIRIGLTAPLTGANAVYGQAVQWGMEVAVEQINASAGENGLKIEFRVEDDVSDGETGLNAYNKLKDWGMQIFAGAVTTGPCNTIAPQAVEDHVFMMTPSGSAESIVQTGENIYQMCFTDPNQGAASAQLIAAQKLGTKIGVIYDSSTDYSTGIWKSFKAEAAKLGLDVAEEAVTSFTADSASEMTTQLTKCKEAGCDLVFLPIYATEASVVLNNANSMGYAPAFLGCDGMDGILAVDGFDVRLAEGLIMMTPFAADADDEATRTFVEQFKAKSGGVTPNQFAADGYDVIYSIYNGCVEKGVDGTSTAAEACAKLCEYFQSTTYSGLTGTNMTWDENGMVSKIPTAVEVVDGAYVKK